jgi:hypothetical protein
MNYQEPRLNSRLTTTVLHHPGQPCSTIDEVDKEIEMSQHDLNEEIKSISRWHQAQRGIILEQLANIDEQYKNMVNEYTTKWTNRLRELYIECDAISQNVARENINPPPTPTHWCPPTRTTADGRILSTPTIKKWSKLTRGEIAEKNSRDSENVGMTHDTDLDMESYNEVFTAMYPAKNRMIFNQEYYPPKDAEDVQEQDVTEKQCQVVDNNWTIFGYIEEDDVEKEINIVSDAETEEDEEYDPEQ